MINTSLKTVRLALLAAAGLGTILAPASPARAEKILLLTADNRLVAIDSAAPSQILTNVPITGVTAGESLLGIDTRPRDGTLVALSSGSRLYNVVSATGAASVIGTAPFAPALNGQSFGFDFNPAVDRIRLVSNAQQDLRLNPDTGAVVGTDGAETFAANDVNAALIPVVTAAAYTSSGPNATVTQLYVIDPVAGVLALQSPPNTGTLNTVGSLGITPEGNVAGFDISNATERGYAVLTVGGVQTLYAISLSTGAAASLGALPKGLSVADLTVPPANVLRRQRAAAYISKGRPLYADFTVGAPGVPSNGGAPVRVLIRGLGPSLSPDGSVEGFLQDPRLRVYSADGVRIANNDNFVLSADVVAITASGFPPANPNEPAVILNLQPGFYSARLVSKSSADEGSARIEFYELD